MNSETLLHERRIDRPFDRNGGDNGGDQRRNRRDQRKERDDARVQPCARARGAPRSAQTAKFDNDQDQENDDDKAVAGQYRRARRRSWG